MAARLELSDWHAVEGGRSDGGGGGAGGAAKGGMAHVGLMDETRGKRLSEEEEGEEETEGRQHGRRPEERGVKAVAFSALPSRSNGEAEEYELEYEPVRTGEDRPLAESQRKAAARRRLVNALWRPVNVSGSWLRTYWYIPVSLLVMIPIILYIILAMTPVARSEALLPRTIRDAKEVLVVVAHPDDECLFFSPSMRNVLQRATNASGNILVMSAGNNYGLGQQRKQELKGSCVALGVPEDRCEDLDMPNIQDDPHKWWPERELMPVLAEYVNKWSVDLVITFDEGGVSGHINHRAVGSAVKALVSTNSTFPPAYKSITVNVLRKYSGIFDLIPTFIFFIPRLFKSLIPGLHPDDERALLVSNVPDYFRARKAFWSHQSQYVWDRHIYQILSRYMITNDLKRIQPEPMDI